MASARLPKRLASMNASLLQIKQSKQQHQGVQSEGCVKVHATAGQLSLLLAAASCKHTCLHMDPTQMHTTQSLSSINSSLSRRRQRYSARASACAGA
jgi:hypothetical protein